MPYRLLNITDDYQREGLVMEVGLSLPASWAIQTLNQLLECRDIPHRIRCDNGSEFISHAFQLWAKQKGIKSDILPALKDGASYGFSLRQRDTFGGFLLHRSV